MMFIEDEKISLVQYTHNDDKDMYECWLDNGTQKGYNFIFDISYDDFCTSDIDRYPFWVTIIDQHTEQRVGVIRLGFDVICPDLAIWIYPEHRSKGYGTRAFELALKYIFTHFEFKEISAGCYEDNICSMKMLEKIGFIRYPDGDEKEESVFTGEEICQLEYRIAKEKLDNGTKNMIAYCEDETFEQYINNELTEE